MPAKKSPESDSTATQSRSNGKKTYDAPEPGALDQEIVLDVTVRVRLRGKSEIIERDVRARFERELPLMFPDAEVKGVKRASR